MQKLMDYDFIIIIIMIIIIVVMNIFIIIRGKWALMLTWPTKPCRCQWRTSWNNSRRLMLLQVIITTTTITTIITIKIIMRKLMMAKRKFRIDEWWRLVIGPPFLVKYYLKHSLLFAWAQCLSSYFVTLLFSCFIIVISSTLKRWLWCENTIHEYKYSANLQKRIIRWLDGKASIWWK